MMIAVSSRFSFESLVVALFDLPLQLSVARSFVAFAASRACAGLSYVTHVTQTIFGQFTNLM